MASNTTTSDSPEATASTTGPQVLNSQTNHAQQVSATHQNPHVTQAHQSQEHPPAPSELTDHAGELVADIPNQQYNAQNLIAGYTSMQAAANFSLPQQTPHQDIMQQSTNPNFVQHTYAYPSQQALQYASHAGQQQYPQMGQQFPTQSAFPFNPQFGNPYLSQQNFQQSSQLQAHPHQYAAIQDPRAGVPPQPQSTQGVPLNTPGGGSSLFMQQPQQPGLPAQQVAPAASSHPICHEVGFKNLLEDQDVVETRAADECVSGHNQLVIKEKMWLHDLIKLYEYVQRKGDVYLPADETYKHFWIAVFKDWDSKMPVSESDPLPPRDKPKIHNGRRSTKVRKGNAIPIYLSLDLDADGITWLYKDKAGQRVLKSQVKLLIGLSEAQAKHNFLTHFDISEKNKVCSHNLQLIVEAARRRIQKWAIAGAGAPIQLGVECRAPNLLRLVLASEHFRHQHMKNCAIADLEALRPKAGYGDRKV
ncbi:uncharacterized protein FTJAE_11202 [Fusarium tjaetaba]|uniref:Uncharacterized protein n=1 Tax=Fusarium tjaetaba TaxID=1567544 RepID=A0A8H5QVB7_9HYPO|nr:uncharacterized protein FTJAE_11202 [Fusarium tjaetaba]KAF5621569.1 hypothetical protein FTJAE_11202 [Fusarium tjaetaba]